MISTVGGLVFSPHAANLIRPLDYALGNEEDLESITLYFTRLVLGVQLVIAGIQLPSRYLRTEWRSLSLLLGPGMCAMWVVTALLVWAMVPDIPFLYALAVGSCVTPTDPVLSNSIVKGKFADKNIPKKLQDLIVAESGANDGLGYPFLFLALYLIQFTHSNGAGSPGGAGTAMGYWFGIAFGYEIIMGTLYGAVVGTMFRLALKWAENRKYVDRESFIVFSITIALFIVGTLGMIGSDDVLACFIAGCAFAWDDFFKKKTEDDSFQATIDMLLNVAIFLWYGAVAPWYRFAYNDIIPIYRLIFLGILILMFRRVPMVLAFWKWPGMHQVEDLRQALFVGFFGPMGVSAIFYLYTSRGFLRDLVVYQGHERADAERLADMFLIIVWFMVICSIIVHGVSIPLGKLWFYLPRTISRASTFSRSNTMQQKKADQSLDPSIEEPEPLHLRQDLEQGAARFRHTVTGDHDEHNMETTNGDVNGRRPSKPSHLHRIGGTVMHDLHREKNAQTPRPNLTLQTGLAVPETSQNEPASPSRSIRYADEE